MKSPAPPRRGLVAGLPAAPPLAAHEKEFLARDVDLVTLLDEFDAMWAQAHALYEAAERLFPDRRWREREESPQWRAYLDARAPMSPVECRIMAIVEPLYGLRMVSFEAILLRHRVGMTFDQCREDVLDDLDGLWGRPCA